MAYGHVPDARNFPPPTTGGDAEWLGSPAGAIAFRTETRFGNRINNESHRIISSRSRRSSLRPNVEEGVRPR